MSADYDKQQWQEQQAQRDAALDKQREKYRKTRERAAGNYMRKLERLHRTLTDHGIITDFEDEFGTSVLERLEKFGSAFHDLEKGRPGDALSFAQKSVLSAMNKKVKELKKSARAKAQGNYQQDDAGAADDFEDGYSRTSFKPKASHKKRSSFRSNYTPRVRHIEDDFEEGSPETDAHTKTETLKIAPPVLPNSHIANPAVSGPNIISFKPKLETASPAPSAPDNKPAAKKPFLRLVPK